jgi:hypothetical protein
VGSIAGWQVGACVLANQELRDDMQDMASQVGGRIGLTQQSSDDDFRREISRHAQQHGIDLTPDQVTVRRTGTHPNEEIYLAADYTREIRLLSFSYTIHFNPEGRKQFNASDWRM